VTGVEVTEAALARILVVAERLAGREKMERGYQTND
jgi:hypothetical protein